jgi:hypothetical protein
VVKVPDSDDGYDKGGKERRTGNAKDSTIFELVRDSILDFPVRFIVDRR